MQQNDIQATVTRVLGEVAKVDPAVVARDKRLREDLGLDSLTLIEVAVAAEDAFGVPLRMRIWSASKPSGTLSTMSNKARASS
jgi:acyl carrier protein